MPVAFRAASGTGNAANSTTFAPAVPTGSSPADVAVVTLCCWAASGNGATPTVTPPGGFTQKTTFTSGDGKAKNFVYWKRLTAADTGTYSFGLSVSCYSTAQVQTFAGCVATGDPFDVVGTPVAGTYGTVASISLTTTDPNGAIVWGSYNDSSGTHTPPTGHTETVDADCGSSTYKLAAGSSGSTTVSGATISTSSAAGAWAGALLSEPVPAGVAGASPWYRADAIPGLSDGASLITWPDSVGAYVTEQPTSTLRPTWETAEINALAVARFRTASQDKALRSAAPIGNTSKTVFAVVRPSDVAASSTTPQTIWGGDGGNLRLRIINGKFDLVKVGVAILVTGATTPVDGTAYLVCATYVSATSATLHVNGAQDGTATHAQTLTASSWTYLGATGIFGGEAHFGDIAEVIVYDSTALNSTDRGTVTSYLATKWGISTGGPLAIPGRPQSYVPRRRAANW